MKDKKELIDTSYGGKLYRDVVIGAGKYKGYYTNYVGLGTMIFVNGKNEIKITEKPPNRTDWMEYCWDKFIEKVHLGE